MRDISDRYHVQSISSLASPKRIGGYLVEAGLLTHDQINVALNDQQATGMRFGEIIVARGWLKEQTVEWIVTKVIEPERQSGDLATEPAQAESAPNLRWAASQPAPADGSVKSGSVKPNRPTVVKHSAHSAHTVQNLPIGTDNAEPRLTAAERAAQKNFVRREVPIAKPLPSVSSPDGDVNWVG